MSSQRPSLIIVDDDPLIADTLHFVLGREYEVHVADSRAMARSLLRQLESPPSLALPMPNSENIDQQLVIMNGVNHAIITYSNTIKVFIAF